MSQRGIVINSGGYGLLGTLFQSRESGPRPTVLILHGVPGIEKNYDLAHLFRDKGWNALIFHYRGCWGSPGVYSLETIPADVLAAVSYLDSGRYEFIDRRRLAVVGHSLGGWAAVLAAAREPRLQAVAVYGSVTGPAQQDWVPSYAAAEFTPWLHGITPREFVTQWRNLDQKFSALESAKLLAPRPFLVIHSRGDEVIPFRDGRSLYDHAAEPKTFLEHPIADHAFTWHRTWLQNHLIDWLIESLH